MSEETLNTYTLELRGPRPERIEGMQVAPDATFRIGDDLIEEAEENLSDLLPEGYSVRIRPWDWTPPIEEFRCSPEDVDESGGLCRSAFNRQDILSTYCYRGDHKLCQVADPPARCKCLCHT